MKPSDFIFLDGIRVYEIDLGIAQKRFRDRFRGIGGRESVPRVEKHDGLGERPRDPQSDVHGVIDSAVGSRPPPRDSPGLGQQPLTRSVARSAVDDDPRGRTRSLFQHAPRGRAQAIEIVERGRDDGERRPFAAAHREITEMEAAVSASCPRMPPRSRAISIPPSGLGSAGTTTAEPGGIKVET